MEQRYSHMPVVGGDAGGCRRFLGSSFQRKNKRDNVTGTSGERERKRERHCNPSEGLGTSLVRRRQQRRVRGNRVRRRRIMNLPHGGSRVAQARGHSVDRRGGRRRLPQHRGGALRHGAACGRRHTRRRRLLGRRRRHLRHRRTLRQRQLPRPRQLAGERGHYLCVPRSALVGTVGGRCWVNI